MPRILSLLVSTISYLPTVLTGIALRTPSFTVQNNRDAGVGGWVVTMPPMGGVQLNELLDCLPKHMYEILEVAP